MSTRIPQPRFIDSYKSLEEFGHTIAVDTETVDGIPFAVGIHDDEGNCFIFEWAVNPLTRTPIVPSAELRALRSFLEGGKRIIVMHNSGFDVAALYRLGIDLEPFLYRGYDPSLYHIEDTLVASHVHNSMKPHGLKDLGLLHCNIIDDDEQNLRSEVIAARRKVGKIKSTHIHEDYWLPKHVDMHSTLLRDYLVRDVQRTILLWLLYTDHFENSGHAQAFDCYCRKLHNTSIAYFLKKHGMYVRPRALPALRREMSETAEKLLKKCVRLSGNRELNVNSGPQISDVLLHAFRLPKSSLYATPGSTKPGAKVQVSTKAEHLEAYLDDPAVRVNKRAVQFIETLLEYRAYSKGESYLDEYYAKSRGDGCLHASPNTTGTGTTRWSYADPNLQNVSKKSKMPLRKAFGPPRDEVWFAIDYSQLELRIFAVAADSKPMQDAFAAGEDIHSMVAQHITGLDADQITSEMRRSAKAVNFGIIYGMGEAKGVAKAGQLYYDYKERFPEVTTFQRKTIADARRNGYVTTLGGYRLTVDPQRAYAGVDYICQGTAGDIIETAICDIDDYYRDHPNLFAGCFPIIVQVHDELLFRFKKYAYQPSTIATIARIMQDAGQKLNTPVYTPVEVSKIAVNWGEPKKMRLNIPA